MSEETKQEITHIEKVEIKGLWGQYDIDWKLNKDVNILIGINGSGKSTILNLIYELLRGARDGRSGTFLSIYYNNPRIEKATINLNGDSSSTLTKIPKSEQGQAERVIKKLEELTSKNKVNDNNNDDNNNEHLKSDQDKNYMRASYEFNNSIRVDRVNTFDTTIDKSVELIEKLRADRVNTELDYLLKVEGDEFKSYQLTLNKIEKAETGLLEKQIFDIATKKENPSPMDMQTIGKLYIQIGKIRERIYSQRSFLISTINRLFQQTDKVVDFDESNSFIFSRNDKTVFPYQLSSGEKQLLIILLKAVNQSNQPSILLMDEPEISLHLSWQIELIEIIRQLNPNAQVIIATHSPGIFQNGWFDKITKMEDILKPSGQ